MKKIFVIIACALVATAVWAQNNAPTIRIVGQNMENYFLNLQNSFSSSSTMAELEAKTNKIVRTFAQADADIYAMCELEVSDTIVGYLTHAMNETAGGTDYAYVRDGLYDSSDGATKVGFIYKISTVKPIGRNNATTTNFYRYRMRWQAFEALDTHERFVVSMNHFKAKSGANDVTTNSTRMMNAQDLYAAMPAMQAVDPDIIVLGDLNCEASEEPIQYLVNTAGLEEQLLRYHPTAYSHRYMGVNQLIDHVMANQSAANMVVDANVSHGNTSYSANRFSDHDTYWVDLAMNTSAPRVVFEEPFSEGMGEFTTYDAMPNEVVPNVWVFTSQYGMKGTSYSDVTRTRYDAESWLISPSISLSSEMMPTLTFDHAYRYTTTPQTDYTLCISTDYAGGDPANATWSQLTIPAYSTGSDWNFVSSGEIDLSDYKGCDIRFAFHYLGNTTAAGTWEIRNVKIMGTPVESGVENIFQDASGKQQSEKILRDGILLIRRGQVLYDVLGNRVR